MLSFDFPYGWYILLVLILGLWGFLTLYTSKTDMRKSLKFGIVALVFGSVTEAVGIGFGLWIYAGGNWPYILWPSYFIVGSCSYLAFKVLDKK